MIRYLFASGWTVRSTSRLKSTYACTTSAIFCRCIGGIFIGIFDASAVEALQQMERSHHRHPRYTCSGSVAVEIIVRRSAHVKGSRTVCSTSRSGSKSNSSR